MHSGNRLENDVHDLAVDTSGTPSMDTPATYHQQREMQHRHHRDPLRTLHPLHHEQPRCKSPTPASSTCGDNNSANNGAPSHRPASPVKQTSVPRAVSARSPGQVHYSASRHQQSTGVSSSSSPAAGMMSAFRERVVSTPSGAVEALRELDESMDQLCESLPTPSRRNNNTTSGSSNTTEEVGEALQEVCDKLEFLSEIVLSHERRLNQEGSSSCSSPSPARDESSKALVNSILHKVDAVENMMQQVRSAQNSPAANISDEEDTEEVGNNVSPARGQHSHHKKSHHHHHHSHNSNNHEVAETVDSAMKCISKQISEQNDLLVQVIHQNHQLASSATRGATPSSSAAARSPYAAINTTTGSAAAAAHLRNCHATPMACEKFETESGNSATASMMDEISPQGGHFSVTRERTPEALLVAREESAKRRMEAAGADEEAVEEYLSAARSSSSRNNNNNNVPPTARLLTSDDFDDMLDEEEDEDDEYTTTDVNDDDDTDISYDNDEVSRGPAAAQQQRGRAADEISVDVDIEVAEEREYVGGPEADETSEVGDNSSPRRAVYGAVDEYLSQPRRREVRYYDYAAPEDRPTETETESDVTPTELTETQTGTTTENDEYMENDEEEEDGLEYPDVVASSSSRRRRADTPALYQDDVVSPARYNHHYAEGGASSSRRSSPQQEAGATPSASRTQAANRQVVLEGATTPQPVFLVRSALRGDVMSASKMPEKRALFDSDSSSADDDDEDEMLTETEDTAEYTVEENDDTVDVTQTTATTTTTNGAVSASVNSSTLGGTVVVPTEMLQRLLDELEGLRGENKSLKAQLEWSLNRTDLVSERLLELSPCH